MTDQPCLEVPFDEVEKWEKIQGSCARLYAAAEWGYKKGLKEQRSIAIRELADQLRLEMPLGDTDADAGVFAAHHAIYAAILTIATELENAQ